MECIYIPKISYREFSETIHSKVGEKRIPLNGSIEVTLRCNLRCLHCYCSYNSQKKELSYKDFCRIFDEIADMGCLWLLITGGEPLLREDFLKIYTYAKKKGFIITLFTNATLLTPSIVDYLKDYPPFAVEVTLYGITKSTYEKITRIPGSFNRCIEGIHLLLERKIPLRLKTVVMNLNKHELFKIKRFAENLGVEFRFDPLINPKLDGSKEPCKLRISPQEVIELDLMDKKRKEAWEEFCKKFPSPINSEWLYSCSAGRTSFHIDPYGDLNICIIARFYAYNLLKGTFKEGWETFIPEKILSLKKDNRYECNRCQLRDLCNRCPAWSQLEAGNPQEVVDYLCQIAHLRAKVFGFGRERKEVGKNEKERKKILLQTSDKRS